MCGEFCILDVVCVAVLWCSFVLYFVGSTKFEFTASLVTCVFIFPYLFVMQNSGRGMAAAYVKTSAAGSTADSKPVVAAKPVIDRFGFEVRSPPPFTASAGTPSIDINPLHDQLSRCRQVLTPIAAKLKALTTPAVATAATASAATATAATDEITECAAIMWCLDRVLKALDSPQVLTSDPTALDRYIAPVVRLLCTPFTDPPLNAPQVIASRGVNADDCDSDAGANRTSTFGDDKRMDLRTLHYTIIFPLIASQPDLPNHSNQWRSTHRHQIVNTCLASLVSLLESSTPPVVLVSALTRAGAIETLLTAMRTQLNAYLSYRPDQAANESGSESASALFSSWFDAAPEQPIVLKSCGSESPAVTLPITPLHLVTVLRWYHQLLLLTCLISERTGNSARVVKRYGEGDDTTDTADTADTADTTEDVCDLLVSIMTHIGSRSALVSHAVYLALTALSANSDECWWRLSSDFDLVRRMWQSLTHSKLRLRLMTAGVRFMCHRRFEPIRRFFVLSFSCSTNYAFMRWFHHPQQLLQRQRRSLPPPPPLQSYQSLFEVNSLRANCPDQRKCDRMLCTSMYWNQHCRPGLGLGISFQSCSVTSHQQRIVICCYQQMWMRLGFGALIHDRTPPICQNCMIYYCVMRRVGMRR